MFLLWFYYTLETSFVKLQLHYINFLVIVLLKYLCNIVFTLVVFSDSRKGLSTVCKIITKRLHFCNFFFLGRSFAGKPAALSLNNIKRNFLYKFLFFLKAAALALIRRWSRGIARPLFPLLKPPPLNPTR